MDNQRSIKASKCMRKQKRARHKLARDLNIKCGDVPTRNLVICNAGLVTDFQLEMLDNILSPLATNYSIIMPPNKSYCFVTLTDENAAKYVHDKIHGRFIEGHNSPLYLTYTESVPKIEENTLHELPQGLKLFPDFVTIEEESRLLSSVDWSRESDLKHRKVKHFGYEFDYDTNRVNQDCPIAPIPQEYEFIQKLFENYGIANYVYDQLTINHYLPGQGIPPHIDTHSIFEDTILSLSMGSACVMDFKQGEKKLSLLLPRRSLLVMSGESRYAWSHGICPRHSDVMNEEKSLTTRPRGIRTSFTFRKVRKGDCQCKFEEYCDTKRIQKPIRRDLAVGLETSYVHEVYDKISDHFDETRQKQWPNVTDFLNNIKPGSFLLDVGCGNGKYLTHRPGIFKVGCDRSSGLASICKDKSFEVILCDCLQLPFSSNSLDAAISIAVIHHLSTPDRRKTAFCELLRVLRPGGRCLIYVWAKEQRREAKDSTYLRYNSKKIKDRGNTEDIQQLFDGLTLPVHENRTKFNHSDVLVPWKRKGGGEFLRYYHVFEEDEFRHLCEGLPMSRIERIYYDEGNWCSIMEKI